MRQRRSLIFAVCVATVVLVSNLPVAQAIPAFYKGFQEKYLKTDSTEESDKTFADLVTKKAKCNVCHEGRSKKMHNAYGLKLKDLLKKDDFKAARVKAEPEKCNEEINAALDKVAAMKSGGDDSPTYGELIAQGKLPGEKSAADDSAQASAPTPEPTPQPEPDKPAPEPAASPAPANQEAVAAIQEIGGTVMPLAMTDDSLVVDFHLGGTALTDDGLVHVKALPKVYELHLKDTQITDAGLAHLAEMTTLARLHLEKTKVTDAGLEHLKGLGNLEYLNLYGTAVTDAGLDHLKGLNNLKKLYLWQSQATDEGIAKLKESLPDVTIVK